MKQASIAESLAYWCIGISMLMIWPSCSDETIRRMEQIRFAAQIAQDSLVLKRDLHESLLYIHSNALEESKDEFLATVRRGNIEYHAMESVVPSRVERLSRIALVDGTVDVSGRYEALPFAVRLRYTSVYRRKLMRWQLLRWQSTQVKR